MKKLILSVLVVVVISIPAFSQDKKFSFSVGPELGFSTGSFSNTHSVGIGGTIQGEYLVMDKLKATATFGLIGYAGKRGLLNPDKAAQRIIPLRIGAKYFLTGGLYGGAQLGVAFLSNYAQHSGTAFAYSPLMLGYEFKLKSDNAFDATVKYDAYTGSGMGTIGTFGIRVAYIF
ncbi:MAG: outer membrane beta-barrel protein [Ferruginibacter sp.]